MTGLEQPRSAGSGTHRGASSVAASTSGDAGVLSARYGRTGPTLRGGSHVSRVDDYDRVVARWAGWGAIASSTGVRSSETAMIEASNNSAVPDTTLTRETGVSNNSPTMPVTIATQRGRTRRVRSATAEVASAKAPMP